MSRGAALGAGRPLKSGDLDRNADGYLPQSERPLTCLVFLLPLILAYEIGTRFLMTGSAEGHPQQIIAFVMMRQFFEWFGATGSYLPALAIVSILVTWHVARGDRWDVRVDVLAAMFFESLLLALPVLIMGYLLSHYLPLGAVGGESGDLVILSLGAGIYEELVFRLVLLNVLSLFLHNVLELRGWWVGGTMVLVSGVLFSAYHCLGDPHALHLQPFTFRTVAGIYFALLFLARGFGVTAASHAAYDVAIVMLTASAD